MTTTSIHDLSELLSDERTFPARNGFKRPDSPSFIFFDDERETEDEDIRWGRELALDFEEWNAARNHWDENALPDEITRVQYKLCEYRNSYEVLMDLYNKKNPVYDENGVLTNPYLNIQPIKVKETPVSLEQVEEMDGLCRWIVGWHKRRASGNDHWHNAISKTICKIPLEDDATMKEFAFFKKILQKLTNYAPGPIAETVFINQDGTRHVTKGVDLGKAKASYKKAQKERGFDLEDSLISVDRVQLEGQKKSKIVVGTRRDSSKTISNFFDPNAEMSDDKAEPYQPHACALYRVRPSMVMPTGSHRLTIREFERALIAGAECYEDEFDFEGSEFEESNVVDHRVLLLNQGLGSNGRDEHSLTHEEEYLYGVLQMFQLNEACELVLLEAQEPGLLATHFMGRGGLPKPEVATILNFVAMDDANPHNGREEKYLPYVKDILSNVPEADVESRANAKSRGRDNVRIMEQATRDLEECLKARTRHWRDVMANRSPSSGNEEGLAPLATG